MVMSLSGCHCKAIHPDVPALEQMRKISSGKDPLVRKGSMVCVHLYQVYATA